MSDGLAFNFRDDQIFTELFPFSFAGGGGSGAGERKGQGAVKVNAPLLKEIPSCGCQGKIVEWTAGKVLVGELFCPEYHAAFECIDLYFQLVFRCDIREVVSDRGSVFLLRVEETDDCSFVDFHVANEMRR